MTIYRIYAANGNRTGFWVQHRLWGNICARVESIAGTSSGALPGAAPRHDNAPVVIKAYDVRSGRSMPLSPNLEHPHDARYAQIAEPSWYQRNSRSTAV